MIKSNKTLAIHEYIQQLKIEIEGLNESITKLTIAKNVKITLLEQEVKKHKAISEADNATITALTDRIKDLMAQLSFEKNKTWYKKLLKM
jgi:hypothetical protein